MAATAHPSVAAIVVAAGSGVRLGADVPKAFVSVGGRTLLAHVRDRLLADPRLSDAIVVAPAGWLAEAAEESGARAVPGGATRQESVAAGLAAVSENVEFVLVHDVARPFVPADVIDRILAELADGATAVVPGLPVRDTIKRVDDSGRVTATVDRAELVAVQTPQGFRRDALVAAHAASSGSAATDDAALIEAAGGQVVVVVGDPLAFKITGPLDLALGESIVAAHG